MSDRDTADTETLVATRNALQLGGSLLFTWAIALTIRLLLPRYLGPELFGTLSFADAFTTTFFLALGLGAEVYIRKFVAVHFEHASDFFGGTFVLRILMAAGIVGAMAVVMHLTHRPPQVRQLVYLFAGAQFLINANATLAALLHARGRVGGMSVLSVATKVAWGAGVLIALFSHAGLVGIALAYVVAESIKCAFLFGLAKRHLGLVFRVDVSATKAMIVSSLPFYLNAFATSGYGKLDVSLLAFFVSAREVGWYAGASAIAGLTLLITPLIGWVLMPTFARAAERSREELFERIRRSTELILVIAIPVSLLVILGASVFVHTLFGEAFAPAALALRILAGTFVVTYIAVVYAISLLMLDRAWTLTAISVGGLCVNVVLNLVFVRHSIGWFGTGGGGAGAALAMLGTEIFVTSAMFSVVGRNAFDRRTLTMLGKSLFACAVVLGVDRLLQPMAWARVMLDAATYLVIVLATGALRAREMLDVVRAAMRRQPALAAQPLSSRTAQQDG